jgi:acylphosphatase
MTADRIVHVVVRGRVQGVGYRAWVHRVAGRHGLAGWVRNRRDGTVEAVFAGSADVVEAMVAACRRGPSSAGVEAVEVEEGTVALAPDLSSGRFEVRETA